MMNDPLASALSNIMNAEKVSKKECTVTPASKMVRKVLEIMKTYDYISSFEVQENSRGGHIKVNLTGSINKCGVIKPRFNISKENFLKFEKRYLPAQGFGVLIVTTSKGIMTLEEAKQKGLGGKLLSYVY